MVSHVPINKEIWDSILAEKGMSQNAVAEKLQVDDSSLSRWVRGSSIPANLTFKLQSILSLSLAQIEQLYMMPKYTVYFRNRYLKEPPKVAKDQAIYWAQNLFRLSSLEARKSFIHADLSNEKDPFNVAEAIRKFFNFEGHVTFESLISAFKVNGIDVAFLPFECLHSEGIDPSAHEDAFTVSRDNWFCIFVNTRVPRSKVPFLLAHEIAHIFRSSHDTHSKEEEKFCNLVAGELILPKLFFDANRDFLSEQMKNKSRNNFVEVLRVVSDVFQCQLESIVYRLEQFNFITSKTFKFSSHYAARQFDNVVKTIHDQYFVNFVLGDYDKLLKFWLTDYSIDAYELSFAKRIRNAVVDDRMTARAFSEMFNIDFADAHELVSQMRFEYNDFLESMPVSET